MTEWGLSQENIEDLKSVFVKYNEIESVLLYGSRAMGNYKPTSDIDLTLVGNKIDTSLQTLIEFDLDDLMMPYKIDLTVFDKISNPEFIDHIKRVGVEVFSR